MIVRTAVGLLASNKKWELANEILLDTLQWRRKELHRRDNHEARRFIHERKDQLRAIGKAAFFLAGMSMIALFQLEIPDEVSDFQVCCYALFGSATVACFSYSTLLSVFIKFTLDSVRHVRDGVMEKRKDAFKQEDKLAANKSLRDQANFKLKCRKDIHDSEIYMRKFWFEGKYTRLMRAERNKVEEPCEEGTIPNDDFKSVFDFFKYGSLLFICTTLQLMWIHAAKHKAYFPYSAIISLVALVFLERFYHSIYVQVIDKVDRSFVRNDEHDELLDKQRRRRTKYGSANNRSDLSDDDYENGWRKTRAKKGTQYEGKVYYYNVETRETVWATHWDKEKAKRRQLGGSVPLTPPGHRGDTIAITPTSESDIDIELTPTPSQSGIDNRNGYLTRTPYVESESVWASDSDTWWSFISTIWKPSTTSAELSRRSPESETFLDDS
jgi:hypothetical protein